MQTWTYSQPMPRLLPAAGAISGDAMADLLEPAELLDVDVDHLAGMLAFVGRTGSAGSSAASLLSPRRSQNATDSGG